MPRFVHAFSMLITECAGRNGIMIGNTQGGGFPPINAQGQRICRQCGLPGRYKDGKCVEKWGPGPEGPGTVCDRCVAFAFVGVFTSRSGAR